uniref:hypothetical protein n=1 Tax=Pararhizobium sp. IMCC3301 TaxID=3067904 RepID=UPI0027410586|nr:hypothetical protein [Pararhizobium sp. IMCC3301]
MPDGDLSAALFWISSMFHGVFIPFKLRPLMVALTSFAICYGSVGQAASPSDLAAEAEALAREGNMQAAMERMQQAADALWDLQQLKTINAAIVVEDRPVQTMSLKSGGDLTVTATLGGFGYEGSEEDLKVSFAVDVDIRHSSGRVLASMADFAQINEAVPGRLSEFTIQMIVTTPALLDGEYQAAFTLRDLASGQATQFALGFSIDGVAEAKPSAQ